MFIQEYSKKRERLEKEKLASKRHEAKLKILKKNRERYFEE
jgi:hypothetical protein